MWVSLIIYGIWHAAPFAFVIFYAGLQTLPQDQIEAAKIDGASRYQQTKYIIIPHLFPGNFLVAQLIVVFLSSTALLVAGLSRCQGLRIAVIFFRFYILNLSTLFSLISNLKNQIFQQYVSGFQLSILYFYFFFTTSSI